MWYHFSVTVPAGTTEASPVEQEFKLTHGVIKFLGIGFPAGCKQTVKARIYDLEHQIFPANPDEAAAWDGDVEGALEHYELEEAPYTLTVRAYSPEATQTHTVTVFVLLLPVEVAEATLDLIQQISRLNKMLGLA